MKKIDEKKHKNFVNNYSKKKEKHLEKLATKMLKQDEKNQKLKEKKINPDNLFQ